MKFDNFPKRLKLFLTIIYVDFGLLLTQNLKLLLRREEQ